MPHQALACSWRPISRSNRNRAFKPSVAHSQEDGPVPGHQPGPTFARARTELPEPVLHDMDTYSTSGREELPACVAGSRAPSAMIGPIANGAPSFAHDAPDRSAYLALE
jgi:hypothetical protein